jgi:hypothetical protein
VAWVFVAMFSSLLGSAPPPFLLSSDSFCPQARRARPASLGEPAAPPCFDFSF